MFGGESVGLEINGAALGLLQNEEPRELQAAWADTKAANCAPPAGTDPSMLRAEAPAVGNCTWSELRDEAQPVTPRAIGDENWRTRPHSTTGRQLEGGDVEGNPNSYREGKGDVAGEGVTELGGLWSLRGRGIGGNGEERGVAMSIGSTEKHPIVETRVGLSGMSLLLEWLFRVLMAGPCVEVG